MIKLVLILFFSSCSLFITKVKVEPVKYNQVTIEKETVPYVEVFEDLCGRKVQSNIRFGYLPGTIIGLCEWYPFGTNEITIDIDYWERTDESGRESTVLHELGHCDLYRLHNNSKDIFGFPKSIMYWSTMPSFVYRVKKFFFFHELCKN